MVREWHPLESSPEVFTQLARVCLTRVKRNADTGDRLGECRIDTRSSTSTRLRKTISEMSRDGQSL